MKLLFHTVGLLSLFLVGGASFPSRPPAAQFAHNLRQYPPPPARTPARAPAAALLPWPAGGGAASRFTPAAGMSPYMNWYVPTRKCPAGWYCRAQITAYGRFDGQTQFRAGYSVWAFDTVSQPIPRRILAAVDATSISEIAAYVAALVPAFADTYPGRVCAFAPGDADNALRAGIDKLLAECTETNAYVCEREETITIC